MIWVGVHAWRLRDLSESVTFLGWDALHGTDRRIAEGLEGIDISLSRGLESQARKIVIHMNTSIKQGLTNLPDSLILDS